MALQGSTAFDQYDLKPLQLMLKDADPARMAEVGRHWSSVHEELQQAVQDLQRAVQHAVQSWQGEAADGFVRRAGKLQASMTNTAGYARTASDALGAAAGALQSAKTTMARIRVPSALDRGLKKLNDGFDRSDTAFRADLASGMNRITAVNKHYGSLSATEISHQYAIGTMEYLALRYDQAAEHLAPPPAEMGPGRDFPPPVPNPTPPGGIPPEPMPQLSRLHGTGREPSTGYCPDAQLSGLGHHDAAGPGATVTGPGQPGGVVSTGIDSWTPPPGGSGTGDGAVAGAAFGSAAWVDRGVAGGDGAAGDDTGGGVPALGLPGVGGRVGSGRAGAGSRGEAGSAARVGGGGARGFTAGGTGIGRNRPGAFGAPAPHAGGQAGQAGTKERKKRPDYLVEDEATWRSGEERVNPPVVE